MSEATIIMFPGFEELRLEVEKLRTELSMLFLERDELRYMECRNIEMAYMLALGGLEYKVYETECMALRMKRKLALIQAKRNRQEKIILPQIEEGLDVEFAEYQKRLYERIDKMNEAIERSHRGVLSEAESKELKKLYRKIVKSLHPDLHPDISGPQVELFLNAVTAYENGDLQTLQVISEMVGEPLLQDTSQDAMTQLTRERVRLECLLETIRDSITTIKSEYPYTMKGIVNSPEKIAARRQELEHLLNQYQDMISIYSARIEKMLR